MTFLWSAFHSSPLNFLEHLFGLMRQNLLRSIHYLISLPHPLLAICFLKYIIAAFVRLEFGIVYQVLYKRDHSHFFQRFSTLLHEQQFAICYIQQWDTTDILMLLYLIFLAPQHYFFYIISGRVTSMLRFSTSSDVSSCCPIHFA